MKYVESTLDAFIKQAAIGGIVGATVGGIAADEGNTLAGTAGTFGYNMYNRPKKKIKVAEHHDHEEHEENEDNPLHDHEHGGGELASLFNPNAVRAFQGAMVDEQSETKLLRNFRRKSTAEGLAKSMGLEGTQLTSVSGDLMGMKGQAFAIPGENRFFYSRDDWTPGVMAHEMGHLASNKTGYGKGTMLLKQQGGALGALALGILAAKSKGLSRKVFGASALASAAAPSAGEYLQEVDAWDHAEKALDDLYYTSYFYDEAAREAARNTREKALDTYSTGGILGTGGGVLAAGVGAGLGSLQNEIRTSLNKPKSYSDLLRGNWKKKALGLGALGLTLGSPAKSYMFKKQLEGEGLASDMSNEEIAYGTGGYNPSTDVV